VARDADVLKRVRVDVQSHDVDPSVVMADPSVGADAKRHCDNVVARYGPESSTLRHAPGAITPTIQHVGTIYAPQVGGSLN
jgi:hypothetical protein